MLKVGIVGIGVIGRAITRAVDRGEVPGVRIVGLCARRPDLASAFLKTLREPPRLCPLDALAEEANLVVEAAGQAALATIAPAVLERGKDLMVLSVGGLLDREAWFRLAALRGCRIYVPSGAIAGLDGVKGAAAGGVSRVAMVSRKPPQGLRGAPYLTERGIDLMDLTAPLVVFEGSAFEACRGFPANLNVSAALSLAGIGATETRITIVADPGVDRNMHDIEVEGEFGRLTIHIENVPTAENPRTGHLAYLSPIALLKTIASPLRIGT
ncbi:MAG: aspartate dehydrogenase [Candidatus Methylomirabilales bacterium]